MQDILFVYQKTDHIFRVKRKRLWCFHLEVDFCSNEINKNKHKSFQLTESRKNNSKTAKE